MNATEFPSSCGSELPPMEPFRQLLDSAPVGIFRTAIDGRILYANRALLRILGYPSLAELNRAVPDVAAIYEDPLERARVRAKLLSGGEIDGFRLRCRRRGGQSLLLDMWAHSIKGRDGLPCCFQGFIEDATQKVLATDALGVCEQRYRELFESSPVGIFQTTRDGTFLGANPALARMLGYQGAAELLQEVPNTKRLYPNPEVRERLILRDIERSSHYTVETSLLKKDGTPILVRIRGRFVRNGAGQVTRLEGFLEDISATARGRRDLEASEKRFHSLVESLQEGVWEVDQDTRYTYVSPSFCTMLGYSRDELLGLTPFQLLPEDEAETVRLLFEPIRAGRKPFAFLENRNRRKDGTNILLETSGVPFFDDEGQFRGYRGIDRDITERKQAELKRRQSAIELKEKVAGLTRALDQNSAELESAHRQLAVQQEIIAKMNRELMEANRAVTLMAKRVEQSRDETQTQLGLEIRAKILPLAETLGRDPSLSRHHSELKMLASYLDDLCARPEVSMKLLGNVTPTELRVATLIRDGLNSQDIARHLKVSLATVKSHRKNLRRKLNLRKSSLDLREFLQAKLP